MACQAGGGEGAGDELTTSTTSTSESGQPDTTSESAGSESSSSSESGQPETTSESSSSESTTDEGIADEGPMFDLGTLPDAPFFDTSCGEVDFLFVIDNSGSMIDEQIALVNSFPAFITGIEATLETVDSIHVGVTTTDDYFYNVPGCQTIGGLVSKTGGLDSSNMQCGPYADGFNFMNENDALGMEFACAARVGTEGSGDERPIQAMINAVNGTYGAAGQCNEEFVREDALLVIILITDEPDINTLGTSADWFNQVVAVKDDIPENVVVVSIINTPMGNCFDPAFTIADFTQMFGINGFMADICLLDFGTIFTQAIEIIDVACDNYVQN